MEVSDFLRIYPLRAPQIMWFLGAGASAAAGVPTAYHMIWHFKQLLYCSNNRKAVSTCSDLGDPSLRARLQQYFDDAGSFPPLDSELEYSHYFEAAFPAEKDRRCFIEQSVSSASASYGHKVLAALIQMSKIRTIWTTNFDQLVEEAINSIPGHSKKLVTATINTPKLALEALNEERFPLLVKLHGDFQSRQLKNTTCELRKQDAELRNALLEACKRFGLAVIGYSGRDSSVMDTLEHAIAGGKGFPSGLFWFHRADNPFLPRVSKLITNAINKGIDAHLIEIETFDELLGDLLLLIKDLSPELQEYLSKQAPRISNVPFPVQKGSWPVIRLNALPIISAPSVCRRVVCNIGGARNVQETVAQSGSNIIAGRRNVGIIAFGSDVAIRDTFDSYGITDFDVHSIEPHRLRYDSAEHGLLHDAICKALERERPVTIKRRGRLRIMFVNPSREKNLLFQPLKQAVGKIVGQIPNTQITWMEAIRVRIEYRLDQLWLLMEPTIWLEQNNDIDITKTAKVFVKSRLAGRFNRQWNQIIDAWAHVVTGGEAKSTIRAFGIGDGIDATFSILRITAFSKRGIQS